MDLVSYIAETIIGNFCNFTYYILSHLELWHSEWDEFPENKLHKIFPVSKECIICPRTNRKEETVMARLHIGHFFIFFIEG